MENKRKTFFKSESDRNLWIRLNAELIQYRNKMLYCIYKELGTVHDPYTPMWFSNNQLIYDEFNRDAPRLSFEELLLLSLPELYELSVAKDTHDVKNILNPMNI
jgi:hypothetical protein